MKNIFLILLLAFIIGCDKVVNDFKPVHSINDFKNALTLQDIKLQLNIDSLKCFDTLPNQGQTLTIKGFIYKGNVFQVENRFLFYSEVDSSLMSNYIPSTNYSFKGQVINCKLSPDFLSIYNDIFKRFGNNMWMEMVIKGQPNGLDIPLGGGVCKKGFEIINIFEVGL